MNEYKSITPSGFFGESKKNIVEICNFLTNEELEILINFARNIKEWDFTETHYNKDGTVIYDSQYWKDRVATYSTIKKQNRNIPDILNNANNRLKNIIENFYNVECTPTSAAIVRWLPGQKQVPHADKELHEGVDAGKPNDFPHYDISSLFYLNDDYEGGELYFPKQKVQFKPKVGAAYFFPGDSSYIHGVTEIISGIRYTCPRFWTITKHNDII